MRFVLSNLHWYSLISCPGQHTQNVFSVNFGHTGLGGICFQFVEQNLLKSHIQWQKSCKLAPRPHSGIWIRGRLLTAIHIYVIDNWYRDCVHLRQITWNTTAVGAVISRTQRPRTANKNSFTPYLKLWQTKDLLDRRRTSMQVRHWREGETNCQRRCANKQR